MEVYSNISRIKTEYFLIGFLLLAVLPFLILNYFSHPFHEEFFNAELTKKYGFSKSFRSMYQFYGGRYFTYIFVSLNPIYFNSFAAYKIYSFLLMAMFFYVFVLFVAETTGNSLTIREKLLFSLSIMLLYLYSMASVQEGFYWFMSVTCYHLSIILIMLFFIFYIRLTNENKFNKKIFYILIACIVVSTIPGTNELAAGLILIMIILLIIKNFLIEKRYTWPLLFFVILAITGTYFLLTAPGNYARNTWEIGIPFDHSLYNSFVFLIEKIFDWIFTTPLLIITILFIPVFFKIIKDKRINEDIFSINPILSLLLCFSILFVNVFTVIFSSGAFPYERTENFIYFVFLAGWFFNIIVFTSYINRKFKINIEKLPKYIYIIGFALIIFSLFRENNIKTAYIDLLGGGASRYSAELEKRYEHILQSSADTVEIESIRNIPKSFYSRDLSDDSSVNSDRAFAHYFNKKAIVRKKSNE